jgi:hypothetical protein
MMMLLRPDTSYFGAHIEFQAHSTMLVAFARLDDRWECRTYELRYTVMTFSCLHWQTHAIILVKWACRMMSATLESPTPAAYIRYLYQSRYDHNLIPNLPPLTCYSSYSYQSFHKMNNNSFDINVIVTPSWQSGHMFQATNTTSQTTLTRTASTPTTWSQRLQSTTTAISFTFVGIIFYLPAFSPGLSAKEPCANDVQAVPGTQRQASTLRTSNYTQAW